MAAAAAQKGYHFGLLCSRLISEKLGGNIEKILEYS
jgi:hypothetical protein